MCDMKRIDPPGDHSRHFLQTYVQYEILLWLGCVGRRNTSSLTLSLLNLSCVLVLGPGLLSSGWLLSR